MIAEQSRLYYDLTQNHLVKRQAQLVHSIFKRTFPW
jgi:hypothetical protein